MRQTGRVLAGVCVVVLAVSSAAFADHLTKELDLTDAQRGQVEQIVNDYRGRIEALHGQMEALQKEKHEKINAVLTPAQQKKLQKIHDTSSYVCPMHPEVRQAQPGSCPKCGMTLQPIQPEAALPAGTETSHQSESKTGMKHDHH